MKIFVVTTDLTTHVFEDRDKAVEAWCAFFDRRIGATIETKEVSSLDEFAFQRTLFDTVDDPHSTP